MGEISIAQNLYLYHINNRCVWNHTELLIRYNNGPPLESLYISCFSITGSLVKQIYVALMLTHSQHFNRAKSPLGYFSVATHVPFLQNHFLMVQRGRCQNIPSPSRRPSALASPLRVLATAHQALQFASTGSSGDWMPSRCKGMGMLRSN